MAIDFPSSPAVNQQFTSGGTTWIWNGASWDLYLGGNIVTQSALASALSAYALNVSPSIGGTAVFANKPVLPGYENSIPLQSSAPTSPSSSDLWIDNTNPTSPTLKVYDGTSWITAGSSVNLNAYAGNINPSTTNTYDLGTTLLRWRNIYTQDLHLSNGIGDYTIVEGEEDLFIVNNKNKKSYKFMLTEVSSSEVPPKSES